MLADNELSCYGQTLHHFTIDFYGKASHSANNMALTDSLLQPITLQLVTICVCNSKAWHLHNTTVASNKMSFQNLFSINLFKIINPSPSATMKMQSKLL